MADFIVPKGKEFRFNIKVIEKDSFIPQDVANLDTINSSIKFMNSATMVCIDNTGVTIPSTITNLMVIERGGKVDNYYLKPTYQMIVDLVFTDATPSRVVVLDKVYVVPASC